MASLKAQTRAANNLLNCNQPRRSVADLRHVICLAESNGVAATEEQRAAFLDALLANVNVREKPLQCRRCQARFIRCEFNRDGDEYRCPSCNAFTDPQTAAASLSSSLGFAAAPSADDASRPVPRAELRQLEAVANDVFDEYAKLYYGRAAVSSVYVWQIDDAAADAVADGTGGSQQRRREVGFTVMISSKKDKEEHSASEGSGVGSAGAAGLDTSEWHSAHVVRITEERQDPTAPIRATYHMASKVYLDVGIGSGSATRFNGFVTRSRTFSAPAELRSTASAKHVTFIGNEVQGVENSLRDSLIEIYFGKAAQVLGRIRPLFTSAISDGVEDNDETHGGSATAAVKAGGSGFVLPPPVMPNMHRMLTASTATTRAPGDEAANELEAEAEQQQQQQQQQIDEEQVANGARNPATTDVHNETKKKKKKPVWQALQDDEGNTYYWNRKTEETSWEMPADFDGDLPLAAQDAEPIEAPAEEQAVAEAVGDGADNNEVAVLLSSLSLVQPVDAYVASLRDCPWGPIDTVDMLLQMTQWDVPEGETLAPIETVFTVYGDRRKVLKWAAKLVQPWHRNDCGLRILHGASNLMELPS